MFMKKVPLEGEDYAQIDNTALVYLIEPQCASSPPSTFKRRPEEAAAGAGSLLL